MNGKLLICSYFIIYCTAGPYLCEENTPYHTNRPPYMAYARTILYALQKILMLDVVGSWVGGSVRDLGG